jgi:hypothetical protein
MYDAEGAELLIGNRHYCHKLLIAAGNEESLFIASRN